MDTEPQTFVDQLMALSTNIVIALVIFAVGWWAAKLAYAQTVKFAQKRTKDTMLARFLASLAQWSVVAAAAIAALARVGIETTSLVALLASAGVAIGLALQGNLSNFASGVLLLVFRPLDIGEFVEAGGHSGTVEDIGIFSTKLITLANNTVIMPNSAITAGALVNYSRRPTRRASIDVGVAYGADLDEVQRVLLEATKECEMVLDDPAPAVVCTGLGASSVDFQVRCYCNAPDFVAMSSEMTKRVYNALNAANIEIPFNQIVVHQAVEADGESAA